MGISNSAVFYRLNTNTIKVLALIIVAAILVSRLLFIFYWYYLGYGDRLSSDSLGYYSLGNNLLQGSGFQVPGYDGPLHALRPPLYCIFIALLSKILPFPLGVQIIQAFIQTLSGILVFYTGRLLFHPLVGLLAVMFYLIDYSSIRIVIDVMPECLAVFFMLASFFLLSYFKKTNRFRYLFFSGLCAGLTVLTRDALIYFYFLLPLWFFIQSLPWRACSLQAIVFFLGFLLIASPWIIRNNLIHQNFMLITARGGHVLYLANNPTTVGNPTGGEWRYGLDYDYPHDREVPPLYTREADQYFFKRAVDYIGKHPFQFLKLARMKIINTWRPYQTDSPLYSRIISATTYLPILFLGIMGMFLAGRRWRELLPFYGLILYIFLLHAVLIGQMRFRYPAMPILIIYAAFALWKIMVRTGEILRHVPARVAE